MVTAHAIVRGSWRCEHWPPHAVKRSDWHSAMREGGAGVAVKEDHDSNGQVRWSSSPVADGLDDSHCSIHEADINPEVADGHHPG